LIYKVRVLDSQQLGGFIDAMMSNELDIKMIQIDSMRNIIHSLDYHFEKISHYEDLIKPSRSQEWSDLTNNQRREHFDAHRFIKYEIEAYICKAGKLCPFLPVVKEMLDIGKPKDTALQEVWESLHDGGSIKELRDKWTAHRSVDKPHRTDSEGSHLEVLLNLEGPVNMFEGDAYVIWFRDVSLAIGDYHPKLLKFIEWLFEEISLELETRQGYT
jgi:hypothetical protein